MKKDIQLCLKEEADREHFILDNQEAFNYGALQEFGCRDNHFEEDGQIILRETIKQSIDHGKAYRIILEEKKVGGAVIKVDGEKGSLDLLFVSPDAHIVEFFNKFHPDPNEPEADVKEFDEQFPDGMFRFEKRIDKIRGWSCNGGVLNDYLKDNTNNGRCCNYYVWI